MMDMGKGWVVLNEFFFHNIHLKLAQCSEHIRLVEPIKDRIIKNPETISWYQEKPIVVFGISIMFSLGLLAGVILK
jgi:hypothetical protein